MSISFKKILFIINHKAGISQFSDLENSIQKHIKKYGYDYYHYTIGDNPVKTIASIIKDFIPEAVVAIGGDGTVNMVASIIKFTTIKLLIVPYGSANGMAKELNMPTNISESLDLLLGNKSIIKNMDLLMVNGKDTIHLADIGLNARIVYRFQMGKSRGMINYAKHLFSELLFLGYKKCSISINGLAPKTVKAVSITFANAAKYGTGAIINPKAIFDDGLFEICVVKPFPKIKIFTIALQMFRNRLKYSEYFEVMQCSKAVVKLSKKTTLQYDGEIFGKVKEIVVKMQNNALQVIIPALPKNKRFIN
jgi:diacylglycerol kinase (ATP)